LGTFSLHANGVVAPGSSPGIYNPGVFASDSGNETLWITFGEVNPQPGVGKQYSQINVRSRFTGDAETDPGVLAITLKSWPDDANRSASLVDLDKIELLKIGGTEVAGSDVHLAERFTQNGHELLLDPRVRTLDAGAMVAGTSAMDTVNNLDLAETDYFRHNTTYADPLPAPTVPDAAFDDDQLIVYGLKAIV